MYTVKMINKFQPMVQAPAFKTKEVAYRWIQERARIQGTSVTNYEMIPAPTNWTPNHRCWLPRDWCFVGTEKIASPPSLEPEANDLGEVAP